MIDEESQELRRWVDGAERLIAGRPCRVVRRVLALGQTASTQDAALTMCKGESGLLVLAGKQSAGRGRLGRAWTQRAGLGVAASLAFRAQRDQQGLVALAAGVATARAVQSVLKSDRAIGIRWPNDVVERAGGRKLAGVLIETHDSLDPALLLVGIGINVLQREGDWPEELRERAVSLAELGSPATREPVILALIDALDEALAGLSSEPERARLLEGWRALDTLRGRRAEFMNGHDRFAGIVESIEPTLEIVIRLDDGGRVYLPAATTSLVHA